MARFQCKCGEFLSTTEVPNDVQLRIYTDREWDDIINCEVLDPVAIPFPKYDVWCCLKCKRIYFFDWEYGNPIKVYKLEE